MPDKLPKLIVIDTAEGSITIDGQEFPWLVDESPVVRVPPIGGVATLEVSIIAERIDVK